MVKRTNIKQQIFNVLQSINLKEPNKFTSYVKITGHLLSKKNHLIKNMIKSYIKRVICNSIERKELIKHKNSYRLSASALRYISKRSKKQTLSQNNNNNKSNNFKKSKKFKSIKEQNLKVKSSALKKLDPLRVYNAIWQYYDADKYSIGSNLKSKDNFYNYDTEASDSVEEVWQKYIINRGFNDVRSIHSGEWNYFVDFINWEQMNIDHFNHTKRRIRRLAEGRVTVNPYNNN